MTTHATAHYNYSGFHLSGLRQANSTSSAWRLSALAGLVLCAACSPEQGWDGTLQTAPGTALDLSLSDDVSTVLRADWESGAEGTSWVEFGLDDSLSRTTPLVTAADGWSDVTVLGLKAGGHYYLRGVTELTDGQRLETQLREIDIPTRPLGLPAFDVTIDQRSADADADYVLVTILQSDRSWVAIVDRDGDYVWWNDPGLGTLVPTATLSSNGRDVLFSVFDLNQIDDVGELRRVSLVDGSTTTTRTLLGHHAATELPAGEIAWLGFDTKERMVAGQSQLVTTDVIHVAPEGAEAGDAAPILFSLAEQLTDWQPRCGHQLDTLAGTHGLDWSHGNSLVYEESEDALYLMARHLDTLFKIDRETGRVLDRLVPPHPSDGVSLSPSALSWSHPHLSDVWSQGMVVFDNGSHRQPQVSAVRRFDRDPSSGAMAQTWHFEDPDGRFISALGDVRRVPGGSYMTAWTSAGLVREISEDGEITWEIAADLGSGIGRIQWIGDLYDLDPQPNG